MSGKRERHGKKSPQERETWDGENKDNSAVLVGGQY